MNKFFLTFLSFVLIAGLCACNRTATRYDSLIEKVQEEVNVSDIDTVEIQISGTVDTVIKCIDSRVSSIKAELKNYWYNDYFDGDIRIFHSIYTGSDDDDSTAFFEMYYDENGKLIFVEITHYRYAQYSIYFQNDALFYVKVGPFTSDGVSISGNLDDVKTAIEKDEQFAFVLEDIAVCLESAYSVISEEQFEYVIADGFPAFTFEITKTDKQEMLEFDLQYTYILSISCREKPEMISQRFEFTSCIDGISASSLSNESSFVDIDFDGYLDLEIEIGRGNANRVFQYFRWNDGLAEYEQEPFFNMIYTGYQLFPDTKQIIATTHNSAASYGRDMYQLTEGKYVLLRHEYAEIVNVDGDDYEWIVHIMEGQNEIYSETLTVDEYYDISAERDNALRFGIKK